MYTHRQSLSVITLAIGIALPSLSSAQTDPEQRPPALQSMQQRLLELEARLHTLDDRLDRLEQHAVTAGASAGVEAGQASSTTVAGIVWTLDARITDGPLRLTHKEFDRNRGRVDLLLEITAPLQDPARWDEVGGEVPVMLTLRGVDGTEHARAFTLARGQRIEPGAFVHLSADIDPARAATAGHFIIAPTDD